MIENNDEAKRSKIWTVVTSVTSVLIIIVAIFLLMKMFRESVRRFLDG